MGQVTVRSSQTSRAVHVFTPWNDAGYIYSITQINLGNNPLSCIEVVSALNFSNYAKYSLWYDYHYALQKYNPKVYLGAVQSVSRSWNNDRQTGQTNGLPDLLGDQKSGSCSQRKLISKLNF